MTDGPILHSDRLIMRRWRDEDLDPFAALNSDPAVMEHFQKVMMREESAGFMDRIEADATEAAQRAVRFGYDEAGLLEILSFTNPANVRSWKVMERLGMVRDPSSDFEHPNVPVGHRLREHIVYRFPERPDGQRRPN